MQNRMSRSSNSSGFAQWLEQQKAAQNEAENDGEESVGLFSQLSSIQDNFTNQLQEMSGSLPEAGPLSASYRTRITHAIYLLIAAVAFAILGVFIGLPTLLVRPSKFVLCMTLSTLLAASSVIVMQKPSVFFSNLVSGGPTKAAPVVALGISMVFTLYVTIFIHRYLSILFAGGIQLTCLLYYLASFIPGGTQGVVVLLKTMFSVVRAAAKPVLYLIWKTTIACLSRIFDQP
mmetsp:Transcript_15801/g.26560  ORF Transcript_15801/g.26560 Transcript_15801/m.26560 type:complete len:232 (-) Transcript_15801:1073-1768(-)